MKSSIAVALVALLVTSSLGDTAKPEKHLIVPGRSLGPVQIGDTKSAVYKACGSFGTVFLDGPLGSETESYSNGLTVHYSDNKVAEIRTSVKSYATGKAISVGRNRRQIQTAFKGGVWRHSWWHSGKRKMNEYFYDMVQPGIMFRFGEDYRSPSAACQQIQVNRPNIGMNGGKLLHNGPL